MKKKHEWRDYLIQIEQSNFVLMLFVLQKWEFNCHTNTPLSCFEWARRKSINKNKIWLNRSVISLINWIDVYHKSDSKNKQTLFHASTVNESMSVWMNRKRISSSERQVNIVWCSRHHPIEKKSDCYSWRITHEIMEWLFEYILTFRLMWNVHCPYGNSTDMNLSIYTCIYCSKL